MTGIGVIAKLTETGKWYSTHAPGWYLVPSANAVLTFFHSGKGSIALIRDSHEATPLLKEMLAACDVKSISGVKLLGEKSLVSTARSFIEKQGIAIEVYREVSELRTLFYSPTEHRLRLERCESKTSEATPVLPMATACSKARVLIVDDSKTIRRVLRMILSRDPQIEVVGECENALGVEEALKRLQPNVISLDINMPEMDGVTLVRQLLPKRPIPIVMVTALSIEQGDLVLQALDAGAVDYIQKPALHEVDNVANEICERFKTAAKARVRSRSGVAAPLVKPRAIANMSGNSNIVLIGSSTGGTEALQEFLSSLPSNIPPILVVQHIPPVFSAAFAGRLDNIMPFKVAEAKNGERVEAGKVLIAPGGFHMRLAFNGSELTVNVSEGANISGHKPSVDALFESAVPLVGKAAIGIILTGMGKDGANGLLKLRNAGARTFGQDEATCVVYGMPAAAKKIGAVERELPLNQLAPQLMELLSSSRRIA